VERGGVLHGVRIQVGCWSLMAWGGIEGRSGGRTRGIRRDLSSAIPKVIK